MKPVTNLQLVLITVTTSLIGWGIAELVDFPPFRRFLNLLGVD